MNQQEKCDEEGRKLN